jgi:hypothetical protein
MGDDIVGRIYDAAIGSPWIATDDGLWCGHCGDIIAPDHFFAHNEDYEPPESCRQCGYPDFGA